MTAATVVALEGVPLRVVHLETNESDASLVAETLRQGGFVAEIKLVAVLADFERHLRANSFDLIISDFNLPEGNGIQVLEVLRVAKLDIPLIIVSAAVGDTAAVDCIKRGAADYILKNGLSRLPEAVIHALDEKRLRALQLQAERDLVWKTEELSRSNVDLEAFAHVASHDLQEPIRQVASYTQLLAERYRGKLDADADKYLDYACEGALRMKSLIQDLLAFSTVGREGLTRHSVDCNAAVAEALVNLAPSIQESAALITHESLPRVWADRWQVLRLFQNLIGNAIKFRRKEAPTVSIQAETFGEQWLFSVSDNGVGIASEYTDDIFVVFRRLHARNEYPGNGIGLAICKRIVEHYGGSIWAEAQPASRPGCVFKFTLPGEAKN